MTDSGKKRGGRTKGSEATRERILDAARDLAVAEGFGAFTVEKVAERAGVSRLTVYYQFGSKPELLEALVDHLADRGGMARLGEAFAEADPVAGLDRFIEIFCGFWTSDPEGIRRVRGWESSEPGAQEVARGRDAWRRRALEKIVRRIAADRGAPAGEGAADAIDAVHTLTSFESYDSLTRAGRTPEAIVRLLKRTARVLLGLPSGPGEG